MKTFAKIWVSVGLIAIVIGLGILVIVYASGARLADLGQYQDYETYSMNESYEGVERIQMDIGFGEVKIVEGDSFSIDAKNLMDDELESYVSDGVWIINEDNDTIWNKLGLRYTIGELVSWDHELAPSITVTVPKDFVAKEFELHVRAGDVSIEAVKAGIGEFDVDAGSLVIEHITLTEESSYTVGAGQIVIGQMEAKDITVDCGVGHVSIEGTLTGENDIKSGIGDVSLELTGNEDDYSYEISAGIGEVRIDGANYHNVSNNMIKNDMAEHSLNLDCGIGEISVEFN